MDSSPTELDFLHEIGRIILSVDTRWVIVAALGIVALFFVMLWFKKKRMMSRDEAISLGVALLHLYTAPVLLGLLVLTEPPLFELVSDFQRQSAGLIAVIFLVAGVFIQIRKVWTGTAKPSKDDASGGGSQ